MSSDLSMCGCCGQMTCEDKASICDECSEPAPVEAGERYAVVYQTPTMPHAKMEPHVFDGSEQVKKWLAWNPSRTMADVVVLMPIGAHEAAIKEAREQGRAPLLAALEATKHAYAAAEHEKETSLWLAQKNDALEGKLAEMQMAATPEIHENVDLQRRRAEETRRFLTEKEALAARLAEVTAERDAAVARIAVLRAGIGGVVYAIQETILRGEGESFKDVAARVLAADDAAGGGR